jgi:hypothetical protein
MLSVRLKISTVALAIGAAGACACTAAENPGSLLDDPVVESLLISPKTVTLSVGSTRAFSVTALWSNDSSGLPALAFRVIGGGAVDSISGLYTAPTTPGNYQVVVSSAVTALRDTAFITVVEDSSGGPPPPPPPPPGSLYANRPTNFTNVESNFDFAEVPKSGMNEQPYAGGWSQIYGGNLARVEDTSAPASAPYALQWTFPPGPGGGGVGNLFRILPAGKSEVYVAFSIWHDPNFEWNTVSNKLLYWESGNIILQSRHNGTYLSFYIGANDQVFDPNQQRVPVRADFDGRWANLEVLIRRGNPGRLRVWLNGTLVIDHAANVPTTAGITELKLDSTWGGGGTRTRTSYRRIDHILVATP